MMRTIRIAAIALTLGAGVVLGALPAAAATQGATATAHTASVSSVSPATCPHRDSAGFCGGS